MRALDRLRHSLAALMLLSGIAPPLGAQTPAGGRVFSVRADLSVATPINSLLASIAQPQVFALPADLTAQQYLAKMCGPRAPAKVEATTVKAANTDVPAVTFTPCVRQNPAKHVVARSGDNLEALAIRAGMRPSSRSELQIRAATTGKPKPPKQLAPGDTVLIPPTPAWTTFATHDAAIQSREDLVAALAKAIGCVGEAPDTCLSRRSVLVLDHPGTRPDIKPGTRPPAAEQPVPADRMGDGAGQASTGADGESAGSAGNTGSGTESQAAAEGPTSSEIIAREMTQASHRTTMVLAERTTAVAAGAAAPAAAAMPTPIPAYHPEAVVAVAATVVPQGNFSATDFAQAPVAPDQWPYDTRLVLALLQEALPHAPGNPVVIGVIDDGLGSPIGAPLPRSIFVDTLEPGLPNGIDENGNEVTDDIVGQGVRRSDGELVDSGDVAACPGPSPDYASLERDGDKTASHGTIVSALAGGYPLHQARATLDPVLPKIQFYRIARNLCAPGQEDDGQAAITAMDYFVNSDAKVINLSSYTDGSAGKGLEQEIKSLAGNGMPLLIVPATDAAADLDVSKPCPPCVVLDSDDIARGLLVVGAATPDLRRSSYSSFGDRTVRIYAPAEPRGAIDVLGVDASNVAPATSYAAPLVSFAAALMRELGIDNADRLRNRLLVSTWPLFDQNGVVVGARGGTLDIGVLDLLKVVALHHQSVEVLERQADGNVVRRTYVGTITAGLDGICPGQSFPEAATQSIRFGPPIASGSRSATVVLRKIDEEHRNPMISRPPPCYGQGQLTIQTIDGRTVTPPVSAVTQILFATR